MQRIRRVHRMQKIPRQHNVAIRVTDQLMSRHSLRHVEKRPHDLGSGVSTYNFFSQGPRPRALKPCVLKDLFPHPRHFRHAPNPQLPRSLRRSFFGPK